MSIAGRLLAAAMAALALGAGAAVAQPIVVEQGTATDGTVTLTPAVAVASDEPASFRLSNGAPHAVTAVVSTGDVSGDNLMVVGTVHLDASEVATVRVPRPAPGSLGRLVVDVRGGETLEAFVSTDTSVPVAVEITRDGAVVTSDQATVVEVQVRRRSWLGTSSSHVVARAVLVGPEGALVEAGPPPRLPGPWWTDVLVVDATGTQTRLERQQGSAGRDVVVAGALLLVVGTGVAMWRYGRSGETAAH